jgi:hypothetical protein
VTDPQEENRDDRASKLRSIAAIAVFSLLALTWITRLVIAGINDTNGRLVVSGVVCDPDGSPVPGSTIWIKTMVSPFPGTETKTETIRINSPNGRFTAAASGFGRASVQAFHRDYHFSEEVDLSKVSAGADWLGRHVWRRENMQLIVAKQPPSLPTTSKEVELRYGGLGNLAVFEPSGLLRNAQRLSIDRIRQSGRSVIYLLPEVDDAGHPATRPTAGPRTFASHVLRLRFINTDPAGGLAFAGFSADRDFFDALKVAPTGPYAPELVIDTDAFPDHAFGAIHIWWKLDGQFGKARIGMPRADVNVEASATFLWRPDGEPRLGQERVRPPASK